MNLLRRVGRLLAVTTFVVVVAAAQTPDWSGPRSVSFARQEGLKRLANDSGSVVGSLYDEFITVLTAIEETSDEDVWNCVLGMTTFAKGLSNFEMWALSMIDSSAKLPDGIIQGNFYALGSYDECTEIQGEYLDFSYNGQYCLVDLSFKIPDNLTIELNGITTTLAFLLGSDTVTFSLGQCFPSTCKPWVIQAAYNDILRLPNRLTNNSYELEATIATNDCHTSAEQPLTTAQWVMLIVSVILIFLVSACSVVDFIYVDKNLKTSGRTATDLEFLVQSFSAYYNGKRLISMESTPDTIPCLNGLKFLSIVWVFLGHRFRYLLFQPLANYTVITVLIQQYSKAIITATPLSVDTFFLISGLLNMFGFMIMREKTKRGKSIFWEVITGYLYRYLRLTPSYAYIIAFTTIWIYRLGNGPMWDRIVYDEVAEPCTKGWWKNIVYLNNYLTDDYCMIQSWYLSADMQLFWLSPLLIYPLWRWPVFGCIEAFILTLGSIAAPFTIAWMNDIPSPLPINPNETVQNQIMSMIYFPTHTKATSYIIGILVGYVIYLIRKGKLNIRLKPLLSFVLWIVALILMSYAIFGGYNIYQFDAVYNQALSSFYIGFYRFFWSIGLSWVIIASMVGHGGPIIDFLSWRGFAPLARLTYAIYLLHVTVMTVGVASERTVYYYMDYQVIRSFLGDLVLTTGISAVLSLCLESPFIGVGRLIMGRSRPKRKLSDAEVPSANSDINGGERLNYEP